MTVPPPTPQVTPGTLDHWRGGPRPQEAGCSGVGGEMPYGVSDPGCPWTSMDVQDVVNSGISCVYLHNKEQSGIWMLEDGSCSEHKVVQRLGVHQGFQESVR